METLMSSSPKIVFLFILFSSFFWLFRSSSESAFALFFQAICLVAVITYPFFFSSLRFLTTYKLLFVLFWVFYFSVKEFLNNTLLILVVFIRYSFLVVRAGLSENFLWISLLAKDPVFFLNF